MFDRLIHADWSVSKHKRWAATARRHGGQWQIESAPVKVDLPSFLDEAFEHRHQRVLLGFDFPIGLPEAYCKRTDLGKFKDALSMLGTGQWKQFFEVASDPGEVSLWRPFFPQNSTRGVTRETLVTKLGVDKFDDLLRLCDRRIKDKRAACSLFWTLGASQVGKAALSGWRDVVIPSMRRGARLWPFDGPLAELAKTPGVVIAETYPADAYAVIGAEFGPGEGKRRLKDRKSKSKIILDWAKHHNVVLGEHSQNAVRSGFDHSSGGEDAFDAFLGLLMMIEVVEGRQTEATEQFMAAASSGRIGLEGWILGR
jgi:Protein of unknown function (DUF429)